MINFQGVADEYRKDNIACIGLSPTITATEAVRKMYPNLPVAKLAAENLPAAAIVKLLSQKALQNSGKILTVNEVLEKQQQ